MKTKLLILSIFVLSVFAQSAFGEPVADKMSLNINLQAHRSEAEWRWTPNANFDIRGNMPDSAAISLEYTLPTGKPFLKFDCYENGRSDDFVSNVIDCGNNTASEKSTNLTGIFGFKITMTDELNGVNKVLYSGKFTVGKYVYNPAKQPQFAKNFYYYVDYDWRLTTAYVGTWKDEYTPLQLFTWVWIKADQSSPDAKAYLFYNGKKITETSYGADLLYGSEENDAIEFSRLRFRFNALFSKPDSESYNDWWKLYENPGEYEIKVLRKGELARALKFTIGKDGKPVESNIGKEIKETYGGIIVPVTLSGTTDGTLNQTVLKSGWWGNAISGLAQ